MENEIVNVKAIKSSDRAMITSQALHGNVVCLKHRNQIIIEKLLVAAKVFIKENTRVKYIILYAYRWVSNVI